MASLSRKNNQQKPSSKYFSTTKKGEAHELKIELQSVNPVARKEAVKKVIAAMTIGKDMSVIFTDVVNCIQTDDIELKKLVYLYVINYAKSQPQLAILVVNAFVKDSNHPNPLIRALAIRTMGCIRVDEITRFLCQPLSNGLRDDDPYVRKTSAVCVAKLFDVDSKLVQERGFVDSLNHLVGDTNPTVVSNAVAALSDINETSRQSIFSVTTEILQRLLAALNECTEWGQVFILDALAFYKVDDSRAAENIIERVIPRLQHVNAAVVLSAIKVILVFMEQLANVDTVRSLYRKLAPPLISLLNFDSEIQYVALRNINLIVQKRPKILEHEVKMFFCKYNDPIYVKMEKLEIIIQLVNEANVEQVLLEFKEYSTEADIDFVRRAVRSIGRCAVKLERNAERCIQVLIELIETGVNYIVQEAIIVIKDIFRKYPNRYESIISVLCDKLDSLDEPEAKASMIWIVGEYVDIIDNADELLSVFLNDFQNESAQVQLQLLTSIVKLFLKQPESSQDLVERVLQLATEESENPDLRDRGFIYWRLLSTNPEAARAIVLSERPPISDDISSYDPEFLDSLIQNIATLSSVYHKPVNAFVMQLIGDSILDKKDDDYIEQQDDADEQDKQDDQEEGQQSTTIDLLDIGNYPGGSQSKNNGSQNNQFFQADFSGSQFVSSTTSPSLPSLASAPPKAIVCNPEQSQGLKIAVAFAFKNGQLSIDMEISNFSSQPVTALAIQLNKNAFGIGLVQPNIVLASPLNPNSTSLGTVALNLNQQMYAAAAPPDVVQVAIKNVTTGFVFYFAIPVNLYALFSPSGEIDKNLFLTLWNSFDSSGEVQSGVSHPNLTNLNVVRQKLVSNNVFFVTQINQDQQDIECYSIQTMNNIQFLVQVVLIPYQNMYQIRIRSGNKSLVNMVLNSVKTILIN